MTIGLILSGGIGSRMHTGGMPKQYLQLRGRPVITYSLRAFDKHQQIDGIVIIADVNWRCKITQWMADDGISKFLGFADPGETRQYSIFSGLRQIDSLGKGQGTVIVHDAARPLVSQELISRCLQALPGHEGVLPALPAKDTFYLTDAEGRVSQLLPRSLLAAGQAPEAFTFASYFKAHLEMPREELLKINGSTEIAVLMGLDVVTVEGDERNIKITTPSDLVLAEKYLEPANKKSSPK